MSCSLLPAIGDGGVNVVGDDALEEEEGNGCGAAPVGARRSFSDETRGELQLLPWVSLL